MTVIVPHAAILQLIGTRRLESSAALHSFSRVFCTFEGVNSKVVLTPAGPLEIEEVDWRSIHWKLSIALLALYRRVRTNFPMVQSHLSYPEVHNADGVLDSNLLPCLHADRHADTIDEPLQRLESW